MEKAQKQYLLGTDEQLAWRNEGFFPPRGIGFMEPGIVPLDDAKMSAYNVAKSSYQIYPDVFNVQYIADRLNIPKEEVTKRLARMYEERLIMYVQNPATQVCGWGLYYWVVKLKASATQEQRDKLSGWYQEKDDICTGYAGEGDFDFFNGNHMRVLDNLLYDVIDPWKYDDAVEYVHICPIRRDIRESHVNMWDYPDDDGYRKAFWGEGQMEKLSKMQSKMDMIDLQIVNELNNAPTVDDTFDFNRLSEISGLDPTAMREGIRELVEQKRIIVPMMYLNFMNLGLTLRFFAVRMFQTIPSYRKTQIVNELSRIPEFNNVWEFGDANYDVMLSAYEELSDMDALRSVINSYSEVEDVKESKMPTQYRRWVCRLDEQNGFWEECVFTDDFLQDRAQAGTGNRCPVCKKDGEDNENK